jgi:hypothetical protein
MVSNKETFSKMSTKPSSSTLVFFRILKVGVNSSIRMAVPSFPGSALTTALAAKAKSTDEKVAKPKPIFSLSLPWVLLRTIFVSIVVLEMLCESNRIHNNTCMRSTHIPDETPSSARYWKRSADL